MKIFHYGDLMIGYITGCFLVYLLLQNFYPFILSLLFGGIVWELFEIYYAIQQQGVKEVDGE